LIESYDQAKIKEKMLADPRVDPNPIWISSILIVVKQLWTRSSVKLLMFW